MQPITLVDNEFVTLMYVPDSKMLHHTIHKHVDEQAFKQALDLGVDALGKYQGGRWLSDDRNNGPFSAEFSQWALEDWIPRAIANGWKYWANVVPSDVVAAGTLMPFISALSQMGLRMMVFTQVDEASEWLNSVDTAG